MPIVESPLTLPAPPVTIPLFPFPEFVTSAAANVLLELVDVDVDALVGTGAGKLTSFTWMFVELKQFVSLTEGTSRMSSVKMMSAHFYFRSCQLHISSRLT